MAPNQVCQDPKHKHNPADEADNSSATYPQYVSVESSPWGAFAQHQSIHGSPGNRSHVGAMSVLTNSTGLPEVADFDPKKQTKSKQAAVKPNTLPTMGEEKEHDYEYETPSSSAKSPSPSTPAASAKTNDIASTNTSKLKASLLTKSRLFKKLCKWAFTEIDIDGSGHVDKKELYTGLLLVHLNLAKYVGPAACRPVTRDQADKLFDTMDVDHSGTLCQEEFTHVMVVLCSHVASRVVLLFGMTIMILPILARWVAKHLYLVGIAYHWLMKVLAPPIMKYGTIGWDYVNQQFGFKQYLYHPCVVQGLYAWNTIYNVMSDVISKLLDLVPNTVWDTLPFTLVSCVLGTLLVPWCLLKIDVFFERLAKKNLEGGGGSNKLKKE